MTALVVGAAVSGRAATRLLRAKGTDVVVYDADSRADGEAKEVERVVIGAWDPSLLDDIDLVVASPGVPPSAPPLADALARHIPVWSEIELAFRHLDVPIGAVTATNGKTTVTEAAAAMLVASGVRAAAVGNIGDPLSDAVDGGFETLVVEASSFQLHFVDRFRATAAVLLNLSPDHLDWHGTFEAYAAAKRRILERQGPEDVAVFDSDDPGAVAATTGAAAALVPVSGLTVPPGGAGRHGDVIEVDDTSIPIPGLARDDPAFLVDIAAAAVLALHLGASGDGVVAGATGYVPGRHRRELVGRWRGVQWVNDSKATNPHAAVASIRSFGPVVLVCGGRAKGLDVAAIARQPNVRFAVGIGEAGAEMVAAAADGVVAGSIEQAAAEARHAAQPGDTVLLAPGCASFDMFSSYAERGDAFVAAVRALEEG